MVAWGYEFYLRVLKVTLTSSLHSLLRDTFSTVVLRRWESENKNLVLSKQVDKRLIATVKGLESCINSFDKTKFCNQSLNSRCCSVRSWVQFSPVSEFFYVLVWAQFYKASAHIEVRFQLTK